MSSKETYLGDVQDVNGSTVSITLSKESLTGFVYIDGQGYRVGQIGSFVRIPIGFSNLFGIISQVGASAIPEKLAESQRHGNSWMTIQLPLLIMSFWKSSAAVICQNVVVWAGLVID